MNEIIKVNIFLFLMINIFILNQLNKNEFINYITFIECDFQVCSLQSEVQLWPTVVFMLLSIFIIIDFFYFLFIKMLSTFFTTFQKKSLQILNFTQKYALKSSTDVLKNHLKTKNVIFSVKLYLFMFRVFQNDLSFFSFQPFISIKNYFFEQKMS